MGTPSLWVSRQLIRLVGPGATSQRKSTNPSDADSRSGGAGKRSHGVGECRTRVDEILWRADEEMRHRANQLGDGHRTEPGVAGSLGTALGEIESLNERIAEYDRRIEQIAKEIYLQVVLLKQVKGAGTLIALTYVLTLMIRIDFAAAATQDVLSDCAQGAETLV